MIKHANFALTIAAAGVLAAGQAALAQTDGQKASGDMLSAGDKAFVMKAAQGGMAEVKLGQLAQDKGGSDTVKNFGSQMVTDHTKANDQLKQIAQSKGVTVPDGLDAKDQAEYDRLSKLSGNEFDRAYMNFMSRDHKKDVSEFRKEADKGKDSEIKGFASSTLPTLESHLRMAEAGYAKVTGKADMGKQTRTDNSDSGVMSPNNPNNPTNPNNPNNTGMPSSNPNATPGGMGTPNSPRR